MDTNTTFQHLAAIAARLKKTNEDLGRKQEENEKELSTHRQEFKKYIAELFPLDGIAHVALQGEMWRVTYDGVAMNDPKEPTLIALLTSSLYDMIGSDIGNITLTLGDGMSKCKKEIERLCKQLSELGLGAITLQVTVEEPQIRITFGKPRYH